MYHTQVHVCYVAFKNIRRTVTFQPDQSPSLVNHIDVLILVKAECRAGIKAWRYGERAERLSARLYWGKCR